MSSYPAGGPSSASGGSAVKIPSKLAPIFASYSRRKAELAALVYGEDRLPEKGTLDHIWFEVHLISGELDAIERRMLEREHEQVEVVTPRGRAAA